MALKDKKRIIVYSFNRYYLLNGGEDWVDTRAYNHDS